MEWGGGGEGGSSEGEGRVGIARGKEWGRGGEKWRGGVIKEYHIMFLMLYTIHILLNECV